MGMKWKISSGFSILLIIRIDVYKRQLISGPVSEVLFQETLTSRTRHHLQLVQKNINRMLVLINQVLDFRKIQNKKMGLTIEYRDIIIMLHNIMDNFRLLSERCV